MIREGAVASNDVRRDGEGTIERRIDRGVDSIQSCHYSVSFRSSVVPSESQAWAWVEGVANV